MAAVACLAGSRPRLAVVVAALCRRCLKDGMLKVLLLLLIFAAIAVGGEVSLCPQRQAKALCTYAGP